MYVYMFVNDRRKGSDDDVIAFHGHAMKDSSHPGGGKVAKGADDLTDDEFLGRAKWNPNTTIEPCAPKAFQNGRRWTVVQGISHTPTLKSPKQQHRDVSMIIYNTVSGRAD